MPLPPQHVHPQRPMETRSPKFTALAWIAVILGIVGVVCSWVVEVNEFTAIAAIAGAVLGIIALLGRSKVIAVVGIVLCVAAVTVTVMTQRSSADELSGAAKEQGRPVTGESVKKSSALEASTWDKRFTWTNGISVAVAAPVACKPGRNATPPDIARAVKFKITVTNNTSAAFETALLSLGEGAVFNGRQVEKIFDRDGGCDSTVESATVPPGDEYVFDLAYSVGAEPGEMRLVFEPAFNADHAEFVGQA